VRVNYRAVLPATLGSLPAPVQVPQPRPVTVRWLTQLPAGPTPQTHPAKLRVLRAGVRGGRLDVLALLTRHARGRVVVSYLSAGRTTRFSASIADGRVRFKHRLPAAQRSKRTGIVTLSYEGDDLVRGDTVRLRAALGKARLRTRTARINGAGRLRASGTITRRAGGGVRLRIDYLDGGIESHWQARARVRDGRWSLTRRLPATVAATGGQLVIAFTGDARRRIRGERLTKAVAPQP